MFVIIINKINEKEIKKSLNDLSINYYDGICNDISKNRIFIDGKKKKINKFIKFVEQFNITIDKINKDFDYMEYYQRTGI